MVMSFTQGHKASKCLGQDADQVVRPLITIRSGSPGAASLEAPTPLSPSAPPLSPGPLAGALYEQTPCLFTLKYIKLITRNLSTFGQRNQPPLFLL